jgi:hypothetical protein
MTWFPQTLAAAGPWAAFLGLAVGMTWLMASDRLITRKAVERAIQAERRAAEAEQRRADDWRTAAAVADARADLHGQQLTEILSVLRRPRETA